MSPSALALSESPAMEGDLQNLSLYELIQFFHLQAKDGVLAFEDEDGIPLGAFYYARRQIIHAVYKNREGPEAVYASLALTRGHFTFVAGDPRPPRLTVKETVQNLILEGLRRLEEPTHLVASLPPDDHPVFLAPEPPQDDIRLTAKEWSILSLVNGKRTIAQVIESSSREASDVRMVLASLLAADLVLEERDSRFLDAIVPELVPDTLGTGSSVRFAAPTLLGTVILKKVDGLKSLRHLLAELSLPEERLFEDLRILVRHGRVRFRQGEHEYRRTIENA